MTHSMLALGRMGSALLALVVALSLAGCKRAAPNPAPAERGSAPATSCDLAAAPIEIAMPATSGCARVLTVGGGILTMDIEQALLLRAKGYDREDIASASRQIEIEPTTATETIAGWPDAFMLVEGSFRVETQHQRTRAVVTSSRLSTMPLDVAMERIPALRDRLASLGAASNVRSLGMFPDDAAVTNAIAALARAGTINSDALNALVRAATRNPRAVRQHDKEARAAFAELARIRTDLDLALERCIVLDDCASYRAVVARRAEEGAYGVHAPGVRPAEERWYEARPRARALTHWLGARTVLGDAEKNAIEVVGADIIAAFPPLSEAPYRNASSLPKHPAKRGVDIDDAFGVLFATEGWRTSSSADVGLAFVGATQWVNGMPPGRPPSAVRVSTQTKLFIVNLRDTAVRITLQGAGSNATVQSAWDGAVPPRTLLTRLVSIATKDEVRVDAPQKVNVAVDIDGARVDLPLDVKVAVAW